MYGLDADQPHCPSPPLIPLSGCELSEGYVPYYPHVGASAWQDQLGGGSSEPAVRSTQDGALLQELSILPRLIYPSGLTAAIVQAANPVFNSTSPSVLAVLMALDDVRGWALQRPTPLIQSFQELQLEFPCAR